MSDIPSTLSKEDNSPHASTHEEYSSSGPKTDESVITGDSSNKEYSSSGPKTDEFETTDDKSEDEQIDSISEIAHTRPPSSESLSAEGGIEKDGEQVDSKSDIAETKRLSSESLSAGGGIENNCAPKTDEMEIHLLRDRMQKASERYREMITFMNQHEEVQQWKKTANDPNVPFHVKEIEILARGVVAWLNSIQNFEVLNRAFTCSQCPSGETGRLASDKEKTGGTERKPGLDDEKTGGTERKPGLDDEKTGGTERKPDWMMRKRRKPGLDDEETGATERKPGLDDEETGATERKPGLDDEETGATERKPGLDDEETGATERKPGLDEEKTGATKPVGDLPLCFGDAFLKAEEKLVKFHGLSEEFTKKVDSMQGESELRRFKDSSSSDSEKNGKSLLKDQVKKTVVSQSSECTVPTKTASIKTPNPIAPENLNEKAIAMKMKLKELLDVFEETIEEVMKML
ncbi:hypothetical protein TNCV_2333271 [Trichonephila clavipes]|nr:hypothetical protein TNCV_2333271 [Trichonephila clavipes]